ncbi:MAG TPA: type II secretion system F family protein [Candidatus Omnitrophica bacterium]|nr:MAG: type II secretion system F family protein [Candidatus Omnitrophota bacterium]RKY44563.1 MAG: type II secretion system F family protein [Candidatus Omnitrophota bacterium]HEC70154.1 type II secretion system F family protein [Candidatus Omnitrophota bacterium]
MPLFEYRVRTKEGKIAKGLIEEVSLEKVRDFLHAEGLIIISITEKKGKARRATSGKVKPEEIVVFSRQLTTLIESGISLVQGLEILSEQIKNPYFKQVILDILRNVREGSSFHSALSKFPKVFSEFYISMVKAGEASGKLGEILNRVSGYIESSLALQRKIRSSLAYPVIVISMAIVITAFLILKVIPTFKGIFDVLGGRLPLPTRILIGMSNFSRRWFLFILGGLVVLGVVLKKISATPKGRKKIDERLLKLPIVGELIRKIAVAKFCRTFSTLISSGVPVLQSLDIVGKTSGNKVVEEAVVKAKKFVQEGESLSEPLSRSGVFPPMVIRMISVGEKTGKLEEMLAKIAQFYEEEVNTAVAGLTSMIEPLIIGFLGIVIGGIVVSLFLPILKITQLISH